VAAQLKLKIVDNSRLRYEIDNLLEKVNQKTASKWSIVLAKHILEMIGEDYRLSEDLIFGFKLTELWQLDQAKVFDVRRESLKVHAMARESESELRRLALRVVGHSLASCHCKEHAIIASDYYIKVIGLLTSNDMTVITYERGWQLNELKKLL